MWVSMVSFAVGIWTVGNRVEFMANKTRSSRILDFLLMASWTTFAWTCGLFTS